LKSKGQKGQGYLEQKCKNRFSRISLSNVDQFTSNQDQNDQRPILHCVSKMHQLRNGIAQNYND